MEFEPTQETRDALAQFRSPIPVGGQVSRLSDDEVFKTPPQSPPKTVCHVLDEDFEMLEDAKESFLTPNERFFAKTTRHNELSIPVKRKHYLGDSPSPDTRKMVRGDVLASTRLPPPPPQPIAHSGPVDMGAIRSANVSFSTTVSSGRNSPQISILAEAYSQSSLESESFPSELEWETDACMKRLQTKLEDENDTMRFEFDYQKQHDQPLWVPAAKVVSDPPTVPPVRICGVSTTDYIEKNLFCDSPFCKCARNALILLLTMKSTITDIRYPFCTNSNPLRSHASCKTLRNTIIVLLSMSHYA